MNKKVTFKQKSLNKIFFWIPICKSRVILVETEADPVHSALFFASHRLLGSLKIMIQYILLAPHPVSELEEKAKTHSI